MQNTIQKLEKALLFPRNQAFSLKIWKTLTTYNYPTVQYFWWNFAHVFYLPMSTKVCVGFFISFRSWVICENLRRHGFYTLGFYFFINKSRCKQNKKNPTHSFVDITK